MNRYAQSAEYFGNRGLFRPVGDQPGSRFQNRVYTCIQDALHHPGPVPSWEESRRYWSAILEEDVLSNFARSRKKSKQVGFTNQFLSDNGIDPSQGRQSAPVVNRPPGQWIDAYTYSYRVSQGIPPLGDTSFDIRHPNGMRYQYDAPSGYLRVFYEETHDPQ